MIQRKGNEEKKRYDLVRVDEAEWDGGHGEDTERLEEEGKAGRKERRNKRLAKK